MVDSKTIGKIWKTLKARTHKTHKQKRAIRICLWTLVSKSSCLQRHLQQPWSVQSTTLPPHSWPLLVGHTAFLLPISLHRWMHWCIVETQTRSQREAGTAYQTGLGGLGCKNNLRRRRKKEKGQGEKKERDEYSELVFRMWTSSWGAGSISFFGCRTRMTGR